MSKTESDGLKKISTSFLKEHKYFTGHRGGTITWTSRGWSENKSSVGVEVSTLENYLRIHYTQTDRYTEEKKEFDYKIPLTTTSCNYGGKRYWFTCPWFKNGTYCGKRVGVLYKDGDYFACRYCYNLTYESRNMSGPYKSLGSIVSFPEIEKIRAEVKRTHYKGKLTRKYKRYLKAEEKSDNAIVGISMILDEKVRVLKNSRKC